MFLGNGAPKIRNQLIPRGEPMNLRISHLAVLVWLGTTLIGCNQPAPITQSTAKITSPVLQAKAVGTTYYINNQSGSNCSNSSAGTSTGQPWCDFTPVNTKTFAAGDSILLSRGATWTQKMTPSGNGTSANWISIDAYGSGAKPIIKGNSSASDRTIILENADYWKISNLEIAYAGEGILAHYTTLGHQGLRFSSLYIHDILGIKNGSPAQTDYPTIWNSNAIGIGFGTPAVPTASQWVVKDIIIDNVEAYKTNGIYTLISSNNTTDLSDYPPTSIQGVTIRNSYLHDAPGPVLALENSSDIHFVSNFVDAVGHIYEPQGTTAFFVWHVSNAILANNILINMPNTNTGDQSAIDLEAYTDSFRFYGNYIGNNAGGGIELLDLSRAGDFSTNHEITGNSFSNNGYAPKDVAFRNSIVTYMTSSISMTATVQDNLYYEPTGFVSMTSSIFPSFSYSNNRSASIGDLSSTANSFSSVQGQNNWSYQYNAGSSWANISPYDSGNARWGSNGYVSRFNLLPDTCSSCWIARAWTAPSAGSISLRGRALKLDSSGGNGVKIKITKNGNIVWPTNGTPQAIGANDLSGYNTKLDDLAVNAGDVIRFEVNNNGNSNATNDLTSWAPTVAYTSDTRIIDNSYNNVTYSGFWEKSGGLDPNYWLSSSSHYSNTTGAYAQYSCTSCREILWQSTKNSDQGIANLYVDGTLVTTIDMYASTRENSKVRFGTGVFGSAGAHTLKVEVSGSKNASAASNYLEIDAFHEVLAPSPTLLDDISSRITYSGSFANTTGLSTATWVDGTSHYSNTTGAYAQYSCTSCRQIIWNATKSPDQGIAKIYIDGSLITTIDMYASSREGSRARFGTLRVEVSGSKNSNASNTYLEIDAFQELN
jgi:hypothetical protein